ncbi:hypothetical protein KXD40_005234 [Peronospora effusa]|nr:hypothetical protein KXD40_005234 [Peronospora effusa]
MQLTNAEKRGLSECTHTSDSKDFTISSYAEAGPNAFPITSTQPVSEAPAALTIYQNDFREE